ncbi:hypothetical protein EVAR_25559_1 [Eumeta japonica]|uniref:Uncharacterized protein n=1 Tax=Eumeta variegata TaxID=151549 RepID=A0A4C1Z2W0_EUMVA|nr:hypothetical protein EVAR_25559_1 [Eumeta japonica]
MTSVFDSPIVGSTPVHAGMNSSEFGFDARGRLRTLALTSFITRSSRNYFAYAKYIALQLVVAASGVEFRFIAIRESAFRVLYLRATPWPPSALSARRAASSRLARRQPPLFLPLAAARRLVAAASAAISRSPSQPAPALLLLMRIDHRLLPGSCGLIPGFVDVRCATARSLAEMGYECPRVISRSSCVQLPPPVARHGALPGVRTRAGPSHQLGVVRREALYWLVVRGGDDGFG